MAAACSLNAQETMAHRHDHDSSIIFRDFPHHAGDYAQDAQTILDECIKNYGHEEWRLVVLTSEIHGHLGIYAILGAKMGLFAREYLGVGPDEVQIVSFAGSKPPVSCLNDGLQVSTGATVGHGLFSLSSDPDCRPEAIFITEAKAVNISLKNEISKQVRLDIARVFEKNGGLTDGYWKEIRELGLRYWAEFDRKELFSVTEIK